jgi:Lrp/AsnC family leucine-responsive transcriptional regulator
MTDEISAMDKIDRRILELLRADGRISWRDLGEKVGLGANTVADRVRRLTEAGVVEGFEARVNLAAVGLTVEAIIDVKLRAGVPAQEFEAAVGHIPGVLELTLMTGAFDYMVHVACRDQTHLMQVIEQLRAGSGAQDTHSRVVLRSTRVRSALP